MNTEKERILAEVCDVKLETILKHPDSTLTVELALKAMEAYLQSRRVSDEEIDEMFPANRWDGRAEERHVLRQGAKQLRDKIFK